MGGHSLSVAFSWAMALRIRSLSSITLKPSSALTRGALLRTYARHKRAHFIHQRVALSQINQFG